MGVLTTGRITPSTHCLLQKLAERDALIVFATARAQGDPRFYFQKGLVHYIVQERAVDVLLSKGHLMRTTSPVPIYRITQKGRAYLRVTAEGF